MRWSCSSVGPRDDRVLERVDRRRRSRSSTGKKRVGERVEDAVDDELLALRAVGRQALAQLVELAAGAVARTVTTQSPLTTQVDLDHVGAVVARRGGRRRRRAACGRRSGRASAAGRARCMSSSASGCQPKRSRELARARSSAGVDEVEPEELPASRRASICARRCGRAPAPPRDGSRRPGRGLRRSRRPARPRRAPPATVGLIGVHGGVHRVLGLDRAAA